MKPFKFMDVHLGIQELDLSGNCVVFDMDGTLTDTSHRTRFIRTQPKNWSAFFEGAALDPPRVDVVDLFQRLVAEGVDVVVASGRPSYCMDLTVNWLKEHCCSFSDLYMRRSGDHRPDYIVKLEILNSMRSSLWDPKCFIDDRDSVVKMWRDNGLQCIQVAEGDF